MESDSSNKPKGEGKSQGMDDTSLGYSSMDTGLVFGRVDAKTRAGPIEMCVKDNSSEPQELHSHVEIEPSAQQSRSPSKHWSIKSKLICIITGLVLVIHLVLLLTQISEISMGNTGSGNSASGTTILEKDVFREEASAVAVPKYCEIYNGISANDTPSVTDKLVSGRLYDTLDKIQGVHLFSVVIPQGTFTEEERNIVRWTQTNLGKEGLKFNIVLFAGEDQLEGKTVEAFLTENTDLQCLERSCAGRHHVFNSRDRQVTKLLEKMVALLKVNKGLYYEMYDKVQREVQRKIEEAKLVIREEERRRWEERERKICTEEKEKRQQEKKKIREMEKKRREMRVRDLKDEEEWKRSAMERRIRREERKKGESQVWLAIRKFFYKS